MARREDWPERLAQIVEECADRPFEWSTFDCCTFAADVVLELTGHDPAVEYRGRYKDQRGAYALLKRISGGGVEAAAERGLAPLNSRTIPPLTAQRGDIGLVDTDTGPALAVCNGSHWLVPRPDIGLATLPLRSAKRAWRY